MVFKYEIQITYNISPYPSLLTSTQNFTNFTNNRMGGGIGYKIAIVFFHTLK